MWLKLPITSLKKGLKISSMNYSDYLKEHQPIIYHTFTHAIKESSLAHAYLLCGEGGSLLTIAKYLAKSLICDNPTPLACNDCEACRRFDEGNYADFVIIDGSKGNIKISDITSLKSNFQKTATEKKHYLIYIINQIENANKESLNAILKFLEEPNPDVIAFLTTTNEERLLPTIISRCQILKVRTIDKKDLIQEAENHGLSRDDAEILSSFHNDIESLMECYETTNYITIKDLVYEFFEAFDKSSLTAHFFAETKIIPVIKGKENLRLFVDLILLFVKDMMNISLNLPIVMESLKQLIENLSAQFKDLKNLYLEISISRSKIELNVNPSLLIDHIVLAIRKGVKIYE